MKSKISQCLALLFSISGLVSCSSDKAETTTTRLEAPVLKGESHQISLKEINGQATEVWSITDTLEFSSTGGFETLQIDSRCKWNQSEIVESKNLPMTLTYRIRDLIPAKMLTLNLETGVPECRISFIAKSSDGSRHSFQIENLAIKDNQKYELDLSGMEKTILTTKNMQEVILQSSSLENYLMELLCTDITLSSRFRLHQFRSLSDFEIPSKSEVLEIRPVQFCRVIAKSSDEKIELVSKLFQIRLKSSALTVQVLPSNRVDWKSLKINTELRAVAAALYSEPMGFPVLRLQITNESEIEQKIRPTPEFQHESYFAEFSSNAYAPPAVRALTSSNLFLNTDNSEMIIVPAKSTVEFSYNIKFNAKKPAPFQLMMYQPLVSSIILESFQQDPTNGSKENGFWMKTDEMNVEIPKQIFWSVWDEASARNVFKEVLRP